MRTSIDSEYKIQQTSVPFYGVYYGQTALPFEAEELIYWTNDTIQNFHVFDYETQKEIPVYDLEKLHENDPYELFLSGSKSLITIENPNSTSEKELILFRDSFGSSIALILA